jgi:hypothetical protein
MNHGLRNKPQFRGSKQHAMQATEEKYTENTEKSFLSVFSVYFSSVAAKGPKWNRKFSH